MWSKVERTCSNIATVSIESFGMQVCVVTQSFGAAGYDHDATCALHQATEAFVDASVGTTVFQAQLKSMMLPNE